MWSRAPRRARAKEEKEPANLDDDSSELLTFEPEELASEDEMKLGHILNLILVCAAYEQREHEPGPRWLRMPTKSGVPATRAGLL